MSDADPTRAELPDVAYAVALAALRDMTPARLRVLLDGCSAREVHEQLVGGSAALVERLARLGGPLPAAPSDEPLDMEVGWGVSGSLGAMERARARAKEWLRAWRLEVSRSSVAPRWAALSAGGIGVVRRGEAAYPCRLGRAQQTPELLYVRGRLDQLAGPCVGIVGTRRATHYGLEVAAELGRELSERGVAVISGLARGIDAAAHRGALAATSRPSLPLAVVGGGVDVVYPRENLRLWDEVVARGGVVSEAPPGAPPESWRFPLRNRIIAALSQVLVVVESSRQGGAIHTVLAADTCGVPVLAVPGSVRSPQSEGTNAIIQEGGAGVVLDVYDVLAELSMVCEHDGTLTSFSPARTATDPRRPVSRSWRHGRDRRPPPPPQAELGAPGHRAARLTAAASGGAPERSAVLDRSIALCNPTERAVLEAVDYTATLVDLVCVRTKLDLGVVALAIDRLEELGLIRGDGAAWIRA
ncbi:MAG: DNA-processing protein DprA [Acidimicrobiales bacterium]|jgi:DNA protecting protein DprA